MKSFIKIWIALLFTFIALQCIGQNKQEQNNSNNNKMQATHTLHDFVVKDIDGKDFDLASLKGKKVLVVNVASKCGLTPQYKDLQALYDKYKDQNFVVIGFPANNFMGQEPGTNEQIKEFCTLNYGVTFPMMDKISVKGKNQAPLYKWLTNKSENGKIDQEVTWNFQKFLIDEDGNLVDVVLPKESPMSEKIVKWITEG
ncbi:MAG TPA: glutathione peroxidase [Porphyromonadaceae bacterium]|jgi:glutathione peroxidase|nr:glutathione peroxidase [Bacteroidales bacterium]HBT86286.1 glutathione peroxidase [Porphyromonadaceae bacterium]